MEKRLEAFKSGLHLKIVSKVKIFHGLASFYKRFVRDFNTLVAPLNEIAKKYVRFKWKEKQ